MHDGYKNQGMVRALETEGASVALSTTWAFIAVDACDANYLQPGFFPRRCNIHRLLARIASMSTGTVPSSVTFGFFRTANLDYPISDHGSADATAAILSGTTANTGTVVWPKLDIDHEELDGTTVASSSNAPHDAVVDFEPANRTPWCRVYLGLKLNQGTANLDLSETYWRGRDVA